MVALGGNPKGEKASKTKTQQKILEQHFDKQRGSYNRVDYLASSSGSAQLRGGTFCQQYQFTPVLST